MTVTRNAGLGTVVVVVTSRGGEGRRFEAAGWAAEGRERLGLRRRLGILLAVA